MSSNVLPAQAGLDYSRRSWLLWLTAIACLPPTGLNVMVPLDAALSEGLGISAWSIQAAVALYTLGMAVGQPLAGVASDLWGRRPVLIAGLLLGAIGGLLATAAEGAPSLLLGRLLTGLGFSVVLVVPRAALRDLYTGVPLQSGMAIISGAFALAPAFVPMIGWLLLDAGGWRIALGLVPTVALCACVCALWRHAETKPAHTSPPSMAGLAAIWQARAQRYVVFSFAAISSVSFLLVAQGPAAIRHTVGWESGQISLLMGGTFLGFLGGNIFAAVSAGKRAGMQLCAWGTGLSLLGVLFIALCAWQPTAWLWIAGLLVYAIGHGLVFPSAMGIVLQAMPERAGMAAALAGMVQMLAGASVSAGAAFLPGSVSVRLAAVSVFVVGVGVLALITANKNLEEKEMK